MEAISEVSEARELLSGDMSFEEEERMSTQADVISD